MYIWVCVCIVPNKLCNICAIIYTRTHKIRHTFDVSYSSSVLEWYIREFHPSPPPKIAITKRKYKNMHLSTNCFESNYFYLYGIENWSNDKVQCWQTNLENSIMCMILKFMNHEVIWKFQQQQQLIACHTTLYLICSLVFINLKLAYNCYIFHYKIVN